MKPAKSSTFNRIIAKDAGALISYDPNYRASLWRNEQTAVQEMKAVIPFADVMEGMSDEEIVLLTGKNSYEEARRSCFPWEPELIAITFGSDSVFMGQLHGSNNGMWDLQRREV